jgi:hypothetical protein
LKAQILSLDEFDTVDLDALEAQGLDLDGVLGLILAPRESVLAVRTNLLGLWNLPLDATLAMCGEHWRHVKLRGETVAIGVIDEPVE